MTLNPIFDAVIEFDRVDSNRLMKYSNDCRVRFDVSRSDKSLTLAMINWLNEMESHQVGAD